MKTYLPAKPGNIKTLDGKVVGKHDGLMYYTLGQRKGLGIGGQGSGEPWFVVDKDLSSNVLYVVQGDHHPLLYSKGSIATKLHWISGRAPEATLRCTVKLRYRQPDHGVTVHLRENNTCEVVFDEPERAVTPGQFAVFYDGDVCIGAGTIDTVLR